MAAKSELYDPQRYDRLCHCNEAQFAYIEEHMQLPHQFLDRRAGAARASAILELLRQRGDESLVDLDMLLEKVASGAADYLLDRLKSFVVESPNAKNDRPESAGTVRELREKLKDGKLSKPVLINVRGTLFPAALLTEGWWERKQQKNPLKIRFKNELQRWLFTGFDLWAPSWDLCWGAFDPRQEGKQYYIAQLTEGDEADSLPVIIGPHTAKMLAEEFRDGWGGFEVAIVGRLGHRSQFEKEGRLPENIKRDPTDFYISVDDKNEQHGIERLPADTDLYSAYLWKLVAPEEWVKNEPMLGLNQVYFVWEHTNFVEKDAVNYNLDALEHKTGLIAKQHPGSKLILLQKSHSIVMGEPEWSVEKFYNLYLGKGKRIEGR